MAREERVREIFSQTGAVLSGHFLYTSGLHGETYTNKDAVYPHTEATSELCLMTAENFQDKGIDVVVGPEKGGIILAQWTAFHLSKLTGREVPGIYMEKDGNGFKLTRGYDRFISPNARILAVEDILTTGGSLKKVIDTLRSLGASNIFAGALCNRGGVRPEDVGADFHVLLNVQMNSWKPSECPLCESGVPISTSVGHGKNLPRSA